MFVMCSCGYAESETIGFCPHCGRTYEEIKAMNIINLTPHALNIKTSSGWREFPASGTVARCEETRVQLPALEDMGVTRAAYGAVVNLPEPQPNTIYIVSAITLAALASSGRQDVFAPGPAIRDEAGKIVGADGLSAIPEPAVTVEMAKVWLRAASDGFDTQGGFTPRQEMWVWQALKGDEPNSSGISPLEAVMAKAAAASLIENMPDQGAILNNVPEENILSKDMDVRRGQHVTAIRVYGSNKNDYRDYRFVTRKGEEADHNREILAKIQHVSTEYS